MQSTKDSIGDTATGVTLQQIADKTGFSISTVTKVLRGDGERYGIRPETQKRIQEQADALGYEASFFARSLRSGRSGLVVLLSVTGDFPVRIRYQNLAAQELRKRGMKVLVVDLTWDRGRAMDQLLQEITTLRPEAVLVGRVEEPEADHWVKSMLRRGVPMVGMDYANATQIDQVYVCRRRVANLQARHLLELGHRHIRFTTMQGQHPVLTQRLRGFKDALKEAGLRFTPDLVATLDSTGSMDEQCRAGYDLVRQGAWNGSAVTGVTAMTDMVALGMLRAFHEAGVAVPAQISLIGSENQSPSAWYHVPLTTVDWNLEHLAAIAVEWLVERMSNGKAEPKRLAIEPRLVVRQSTAAPADQTPPFKKL